MLLLATGFVFSACSNDDPETKTSPDSEKKELSFDINSQQFTRAAVIENNTALQGQDLKIEAYYYNTETKYLDGTKLHYDSSWKFWDGSAQLHYYWPIEGSVYNPASDNITVSSLDFVGYCPYDTPGYIAAGPSYNHETGVSFTCDMSSYMTSAGQSDITEFMCAYQPNQTKDTNSGTVPMSFKHPFAYIKFQLAASHPDITINSITLKSLKTGGSCSFNGATSTWSSLTPEGTVDFVMTLTGGDAIFNTDPSPQQIGENYIMIPQDWAGEIVVDADCLFWGDKVRYPSLTTTVPTTWQPGYSYTYTFNISPDDLKVNISRYTEQW